MISWKSWHAGGCVGGGGQPIHDGCEFAERRGGTLYRLDSERKLRFSHENPEVQKAYEEFLGKPSAAPPISFCIPNT